MIYILQIIAQLVASDDLLIDNLLAKTRNLNETTESLVEPFNITGQEGNLDIKTLFLRDMCSALVETVNATIDIMYRKACRVERLISQLPFLRDFDSFAAELCGFYCLEDSCEYGYPSVILREYNVCLTDSGRRNSLGNLTSSNFIQVKQFNLYTTV